MFGASKACAMDQSRSSGYPWSAHMIEGVDEGQSVVALQQHRDIDAFLRFQHLGDGDWIRRGPYVDGPELSEEIPDR